MHPIIDLALDRVVGYDFSEEEVADIRQLLADLVMADQRGKLIREGDERGFNPYYQAITYGWWKVAMAINDPAVATLPLSYQAAHAKFEQSETVDTDYLD